MKALFSISLFILVHSLDAQVYAFHIDTVTHCTCIKNMTIENMVKTGKYDIYKVVSDPSVIIIHLDMMILFGQNGEIEITEIIDKENSFQIMLKGKVRLTIKNNSDEKYIMFLEDMKPTGDKKDVTIFSDVKFVDNEFKFPDSPH
jgi:hypothetical protein